MSYRGVRLRLPAALPIPVSQLVNPASALQPRLGGRTREGRSVRRVHFLAFPREAITGSSNHDTSGADFAEYHRGELLFVWAPKIKTHFQIHTFPSSREPPLCCIAANTCELFGERQRHE